MFVNNLFMVLLYRVNLRRSPGTRMWSSMESEWKVAIRRFLLNNLGQMEQDEVDAWLEGDLELAPLLEPVLKAAASQSQRGCILAEMHQVSPAEIFDMLRKEHPELDFRDNEAVLLKIGGELEAMKSILRGL